MGRKKLVLLGWEGNGKEICSFAGIGGKGKERDFFLTEGEEKGRIRLALLRWEGKWKEIMEFGILHNLIIYLF